MDCGKCMVQRKNIFITTLPLNHPDPVVALSPENLLPEHFSLLSHKSRAFCFQRQLF